ncbi:MAG: alpha/beta fold hydrolase [Anaerolineales bacterium]|nr:alpha/beta fold hydrolase [Anaerolineales bacterium]
MKKLINKTWWILPLLLLFGLFGFIIWSQTPLGPMPEGIASLTSDDQVIVQTTPWLVFQPSAQEASTGLIFYPGGRVDYRSYAPAARAIAAQGYLVVIPPMPLNLAVFSPGIADEIIAAFPEIRQWAIGGHSLGGAMAANYAHKNPDKIAGLVLWAAYPASSDDLSGQDIQVASIFGSKDGLATADKIEASRALLPAYMRWVAIAGGNHAYFGWYGDQPGDLPADITREEQQGLATRATIELLEGLGG